MSAAKAKIGWLRRAKPKRLEQYREDPVCSICGAPAAYLCDWIVLRVRCFGFEDGACGEQRRGGPRCSSRFGCFEAQNASCDAVVCYRHVREVDPPPDPEKVVSTDNFSGRHYCANHWNQLDPKAPSQLKGDSL